MLLNPTKNLSVNFSLNDVKMAVLKLPKVNNKYDLTTRNDVMNVFRFSGFEFLSLGVWIDVSLTKVNENTTNINIEVVRKFGAFEQALEIQKANEHIAIMVTTISNTLPKIVSEQELSDTIIIEDAISFTYKSEIVILGVNSMLTKFSSSYKIMSKTENEIVVNRLANSKDDYIFPIDTIITISFDTSNITSLKFTLTNPTKTFQTIGECNRNKLVLTITKKLITDAINSLPQLIELAGEYSKLDKAKEYKLFRSKAKKEQEIKSIEDSIKVLRSKVY